MPEIYILVKPASGLCNMRCRYCFYADEMEHREQASYGIMQEKVMEQVVKKALAFASGRCTFAFQGGEPSLAGLPFYRKWVEYEKEYNINRVEISHAIQTNGYLINEEWCHFFAENRFLAGLSIDGLKSIHDAYRKGAKGEDTYLKAIDAAKRMQEAKVDFNVLTVVNRRTAPKIGRIYEAYRKQGFCWQQYIACLDPMFGQAGNMEYSLTPEMYGEFLVELFGLWEMDFWKGRQPYIRQFENYIGILLGAAPESCEQRGICSYQNVVEADGSVYPCDFYVLDAYRIGNLLEDDFYDIARKRKGTGFVESSYNHMESCTNCKYHFICRGGCRRHREPFGKEEGENYFCKSYRMFFDACLHRMEKIAVALQEMREKPVRG